MNKALIMNKNMTSYVRSINDGKVNYYSKVDNRLIKSENLSCDEKMIIIHSLSQNESYTAIKEVIRRQLNIGVKNFRKAWKNLEELGCIVDHGQTFINGQFGGKQFVINEYSDKLKKLDTINNSSDQNITGEICSTEVASDAVGTLVHDGEVVNVKSADDIRIDADVYGPEKTTNNNQGNNNQGNNSQGNQDQDNKISTNDFDKNQNSLVLHMSLSDPTYDYMQIAKDYIEDSQSSVFNYGWEKYEREIILESTKIRAYFDCFDDDHKSWIYNIYKWILFINERAFYCNVDHWKLNESDITDLFVASTNFNLQSEKWEMVFQIINKIAEKAYDNKVDKITVSYVTKQLKTNSCLV